MTDAFAGHIPLHALQMPPRSALTSSFSVSDANNEVVCPLTNQDGSNCRKRCLGGESLDVPTLEEQQPARLNTTLADKCVEKRYRSMQEHIRRAHPDYYIPKLPATEESFQLMVNTPLSQRPQPLPSATQQRRCMFFPVLQELHILKPYQRMQVTRTFMAQT